MTNEEMQHFLDLYNAVSLLRENSFLTKEEYHNIIRPLLKTIMARFAFIINRKSDDNIKYQ